VDVRAGIAGGLTFVRGNATGMCRLVAKSAPGKGMSSCVRNADSEEGRVTGGF